MPATDSEWLRVLAHAMEARGCEYIPPRLREIAQRLDPQPQPTPQRRARDRWQPPRDWGTRVPGEDTSRGRLPADHHAAPCADEQAVRD